MYDHGTLANAPSLAAGFSGAATMPPLDGVGRFDGYLEQGALEYLARLAVAPGTRLLDVACGAGRLAIPAARAGVRVTGIDVAGGAIERARSRARVERLDARFDVGDAAQLPYDDGSFDMVVSLAGAMFAAHPDLVAAELIRVCRPGGRIALASWTPDGHVGAMLAILDRHVPPPRFAVSPLRWGDGVVARQRLKAGVVGLCTATRLYPLRYPFGPAAVVDQYRRHHGATRRAFAALDAGGQIALREELERLWARNNYAHDGTTHVEAEYLDLRAIRD